MVTIPPCVTYLQNIAPACPSNHFLVKEHIHIITCAATLAIFWDRQNFPPPPPLFVNAILKKHWHHPLVPIFASQRLYDLYDPYSWSCWRLVYSVVWPNFVPCGVQCEYFDLEFCDLQTEIENFRHHSRDEQKHPAKRQRRDLKWLQGLFEALLLKPQGWTNALGVLQLKGCVWCKQIIRSWCIYGACSSAVNIAFIIIYSF